MVSVAASRVKSVRLIEAEEEMFKYKAPLAVECVWVQTGSRTIHNSTCVNKVLLVNNL